MEKNKKKNSINMITLFFDFGSNSDSDSSSYYEAAAPFHQLFPYFQNLFE